MNSAKHLHVVILSTFVLVTSVLGWSQNPQDCSKVPAHDKLKAALTNVVKRGKDANGGLGNQEWGAIVIDPQVTGKSSASYASNLGLAPETIAFAEIPGIAAAQVIAGPGDGRREETANGRAYRSGSSGNPGVAGRARLCSRLRGTGPRQLPARRARYRSPPARSAARRGRSRHSHWRVSRHSSAYCAQAGSGEPSSPRRRSSSGCSRRWRRASTPTSCPLATVTRTE